MQSNLDVADNSGAKIVTCFKVLGGSKRTSAGVGDIIVVAVQQAVTGGKIKKGDVKKAAHFKNCRRGMGERSSFLFSIKFNLSLAMSKLVE